MLNGSQNTRASGRTDPTSTETTLGKRGVQEAPHEQDKQVHRPVTGEYREETTATVQHSPSGVVGYVREVVLRQGNRDIYAQGVEDDKRGNGAGRVDVNGHQDEKDGIRKA